MPGDQRPLVVVMVADATPMVLTNLRQLATWADLVLTEADATTSGEPREPQRDGWRDLLGLHRPELSIVTTQLAGDNKWKRQRVQRDSVVPLLIRQAPDRAVLMLDADEFLDAPAVLDVIEGLDDWDEPRRLGLVPLFGAVDRVARSIHCCWRERLAGLRDPAAADAGSYIVAAPSLARAGQMVGRSPSGVRFRSTLLDGERTFGMHVTMTEASPARIARKLINTRHTWDERVLDEQHLDTMLSAGVHPAGWWIAGYQAPESWLLDLAAENDLRVAGPMLPQDHLVALRAWAEVRLDPRVPDEVVAAVDSYVAT
ncbi:MAG: hypothetical protein QG597_1241, partial [Actinomycetota bacterium]|nr:hypothetical protein [Actinomycetota bacterium]